MSQQAGIDGEVRHLDFDNCFEGWRGAANLRDEKLALKLTSSLPYVVVFTPPARDYFCVEPVSHVSNAIQMGDPAAHGLVALAAGDTLEAWMTIEVARLDTRAPSALPSRGNASGRRSDPALLRNPALG